MGPSARPENTTGGYGIIVVRDIPRSGVPTVTLVTSPGCHMCEMAKDVINAVALEIPLSVKVVELISPEGEALAASHRMPFPPLILINGQHHTHGRISEKKFRRALALLEAESASGPIRESRT